MDNYLFFSFTFLIQLFNNSYWTHPWIVYLNTFLHSLATIIVQNRICLDYCIVLSLPVFLHFILCSIIPVKKQDKTKQNSWEKSVYEEWRLTKPREAVDSTGHLRSGGNDKGWGWSWRVVSDPETPCKPCGGAGFYPGVNHKPPVALRRKYR